MAEHSLYSIMISARSYELSYLQALQQAQQFAMQSRWPFAHSVWQQLCQRCPSRAEAFQQLFQSYFQQAQYAAMVEWADYGLMHSPHQLLALQAKAKAHRFLQQHTMAIDALDKAQQLAPAQADLYLQKGILYKELGRYDLALVQFQQCIALQPDHHQAYWQQADLYDGIPLEQLQQLQQRATDAHYNMDARAHFAYAAARGYELQQQHDLCFQLYQQGAALKRQQLEYQHAKEMTQYHQLMKAFTHLPETISRLDHSNAVPIFICGLPRSGTTLAEQILSNHTRVQAGDELFELARATGQSLPPQLQQRPFPDWCSDATTELWAEIGKRYLENTKHLQHHGYFTDKMPLNFKAIGLIQRALPHAKIIYCQRDPMDTLWGCYRQLFADGIAFSYDLDELTDTIIAAEKLMQHWHQLLPGKILTFRYEALVAEPEQQIRALLDYCNLDWQPACLEFHRNPRAVHTVSNSQIRQPLSASRMGRWQSFARQLKPYQLRLQQTLGHYSAAIP